MTFPRKTSGKSNAKPHLDTARLAGFSLSGDNGPDQSVTGLKMGTKGDDPGPTLLGSIGADVLIDISE